MSEKQNALDVAAFVLARNILTVLVENGAVSGEQAERIVELARANDKLVEEHRNSTVVTVDWHLDNLLASLRDVQKKS